MLIGSLSKRQMLKSFTVIVTANGADPGSDGYPQCSRVEQWPALTTKTLDPAAWWNMDMAGRDPTVFQTLSGLFQTDAQIKTLFQLTRNFVCAIPCKAHLDDPHHQYQVTIHHPFEYAVAHRVAITRSSGLT